MTASTITHDIDAAMDYLSAALTGAPVFASTVAEAHGPHRVSRGLSALLVLLITDAAEDSGSRPTEIVETIRGKYCPRDGAE